MPSRAGGAVQDPPGSRTVALQWFFPLSSIAGASPKQKQGRLSWCRGRDGRAGRAAVPTQGHRQTLQTSPEGQEAPAELALLTHRIFQRTAQPPAQQSRGKAGGSSCTSHQHQDTARDTSALLPSTEQGRRGWGSARGAVGCSQLLWGSSQGQDGGARSGLPNPAVLAHPSSRGTGRIGAGTDRSSENDSVLLCPLPPQAAVQGAKAAVLLLLLLCQLHKHLFQCCLRKAVVLDVEGMFYFFQLGKRM